MINYKVTKVIFPSSVANDFSNSPRSVAPSHGKYGYASSNTAASWTSLRDRSFNILSTPSSRKSNRQLSASILL